VLAIPTRARRWVPVGPDSSGDALRALTVYLVVVFAIPARLVVSPLGAAGTPGTIMGLGFLAWWVVARLVPSLGVARAFSPVRVALGILVLSILSSYTWSALHPLPPDQRTAADLGLLSILSLVGIALVAMDMLGSIDSVETLLRRMVIAGALLAALGVLQFATGFDIAALVKIPGLRANHALVFIGERSKFRRVAGTASHPIEMGMVLATVLPLALHYAAYTRRHRRRWQLMALVIGICIPMTLSRAAILGTIAGFLLMFFTWPGRRRAFTVAVAPVFVVLMRIAIPGLVGTISSMFTNLSKDDSIKGRTDDYAVVGKFIDRSPWLGRGYGTFIPKDFFTLDNQYLGSIVETGYLGLAALVTFFMVMYFTARSVRRRFVGEASRDLAQSLAGVAVVVGLGFATFDGLGYPMIDGVLFLAAGCTGALYRLTRPSRSVAMPGVEVAAA
jgi:O-antigen ligase